MFCSIHIGRLLLRKKWFEKEEHTTFEFHTEDNCCCEFPELTINLCNVSIFVSIAVPLDERPALFISTSTLRGRRFLSNVSKILSVYSCTSSYFSRSNTIGNINTLGCKNLQWAATSSSLSLFLDEMIIVAPKDESSFANSIPMPELPPVMRHVFPRYFFSNKSVVVLDVSVAWLKRNLQGSIISTLMRLMVLIIKVKNA